MESAVAPAEPSGCFIHVMAMEPFGRLSFSPPTFFSASYENMMVHQSSRIPVSLILSIPAGKIIFMHFEHERG